MKPVLVDRGHFVPQRFIEKLDDLTSPFITGSCHGRSCPPGRNASKKLRDVLPEPAAHSTY